MTFRTCLSRARRSRPQPVDTDPNGHRRLSDPTRPAPVRIDHGVAIAHVGPPGFPGEAVPVDEDGVAR